MADNIRLITWSGENVKPVNDANVYEAALGNGGIKYGCEVTVASSNTLAISAGNGVLCGRAFEVFDTTVQVQLSGSGTLQGRVYIHMDLSNTAEPIAILTETGQAITPPIQQENVNVINGIYEINLATFSVSPSSISNLIDVRGYIDLPSQIQAIADEATQKINALATVARTGSFNDLLNKPTIDTALSTTSTNALQNKAINTALAGKMGEFTSIQLHSAVKVGQEARNAIPATAKEVIISLFDRAGAQPLLTQQYFKYADFSSKTIFVFNITLSATYLNSNVDTIGRQHNLVMYFNRTNFTMTTAFGYVLYMAPDGTISVTDKKIYTQGQMASLRGDSYGIDVYAYYR